MERIPSGIPGLDTLVEGGIPAHDVLLLSGTAGAGKTIFGLQFLCMNAEQDPSIFVSFEEGIRQLRETAILFGWDVEAMEEEGRLLFLKYDPFRLEDIFEVIENNILEMEARRVVIDSISALGLYLPEISDLRRTIVEISQMLRKNKATAVMISEILPGTKKLSRFGVEEFVADGVIALHNDLVRGSYERALTVWKLRNTDHSKKFHPYEITKKGFVVYPNKIAKY